MLNRKNIWIFYYTQTMINVLTIFLHIIFKEKQMILWLNSFLFYQRV